MALTRDGLAHTDTLAVHTGGRRPTIEVQVKTASHGSHNWRINPKAQEPALCDREWFVLALLGGHHWGAPTGFVVPRNHLGAAEYISWKNWLTAPDAPEENLAKRTTISIRPDFAIMRSLIALALDPRGGLPELHP